MPKAKSGLDGAVQVAETYDSLASYVEGFREGHFNLIVLVGSWGIGKSRLVKDVLGKKGCWIEGTSTAFGIYASLYRNRDKQVVIDDVDSIYTDRHCVSLLKSICGTEERKRVYWNARASFLEREGLPRDFETSSRVMIIGNEWRTLNRNVAALEDRGLVLRFEPSAAEVHARAGEWFNDAEIYDWFGKNIHRIDVHSFRSYVKAAQLKAAGMAWKNILHGSLSSGHREQLAIDLIEDSSYAGSEERARAFERRGGGSRSTFFAYKKKYEEATS